MIQISEFEFENTSVYSEGELFHLRKLKYVLKKILVCCFITKDHLNFLEQKVKESENIEFFYLVTLDFVLAKLYINVPI